MNYGLFAILLGFLAVIGLNNKTIVVTVWPKIVKQASLIFSVLSLYIVIAWWYQYETSQNGFQLISPVYNLSLGLDGVSLWLVLLTVIIIPISLLSNWNNIKIGVGKYNILILLLGIILLVNYLCIDLLSFYIFFEASLVPLFVLIGIYGANNKEKAAYYILIFTFTSSLFLLLSIVVTTYMINTTSCLIYSQFVLSLDLQILLWIGIMIGILVKTPLFPFHVWLPVVHSESPLGGSIILAGLILKLTVYLIIRWILPFLAEASVIFYPTVFIICVLTIIYTSLTTLAQIDLKVIIAYSSISHMGVCIIGVFANNVLGIEGSYLLSLSHGFISPGLFIAVGGILYDRYHTRILMYYQGLLSFMPVFALYLLVLSFANIGTPLSGNFLGEFLSLSGAFQRSPIFTTLASFSILLSATYQMKLTSRLTGGIKSPYLKVTKDLTNRESILMLSTILPCLLIGVYPIFILKSLYFNLSNVIYLF
uniref:NADH-ubiquinone oxidoreductase chain 4 n=1 Tax=Magnusiomyces magnusii TaxID=43963 RepID=K9L3Q8_MAGMU|nr:Nad4p [Magnusiomyces magnusii]AEY71954.2 Nad4p [Magnusiomyces magnusii]AHY04979.1 NADH dehydrogenase subunit 4 [Magnusiomyces magnusii]